MNKTLLISVLVCSLPFITAAHAQSTPCGDINKVQDLLKCAQANHPKVKEATAQVEAAAELQEVGSQIPNPQIEGEYIRGKSLGDVILERELRLSQEIEIGGKRGARIDKGVAQLGLSTANKKKTLESVTITTVLSLYRLSQIREELESLQEAEETYNRAQRQYKKRKSLSPENEVSLNVFQLAEGENKLQKQLLLEEQRHLKNHITLVTGVNFEIISKHLPGHKEVWPQLAGNATKNVGEKSADLSIAISKLKVADSEVESQRAQSWPNLTVAPIYRRSSDGGVNFNSFGVSLSLPLPLWNQNGGGRAHAHKAKAFAEVSLHNEKRRVSRLREVELEAYKSMVTALNETRSHLSVERKHRKIEHLFKRGLVSSPLVIESHRQIIEFLKGHHEQEIRALEALWTIYAIDGEILEKEI